MHPDGRTKLAITQGDPAGIGPEVALKAASDPEVLSVCEPVLVGDPAVWRAASREFGIPLPGRILESGGIDENFVRGRVDGRNGQAAYAALIEAIRMVNRGEAAGIVTAPLNKAAMNAGGIHEVGHTEILAKETGSPGYALMLYSPRIACAFVTCHQSYASVPTSLTAGRVIEVAGLMRDALLRIRGKEPRLALPGLNPHAGEGGLFGDEEIRILQPAAEEARRMGILLSDPLPADTAFTTAALLRYDGHVCLYHDQGGIPFKMLSFEDGVNITLGLPLVRTSVDHGTAFDIAWSGQADAGSMKAAILLAARLAGPGRLWRDPLVGSAMQASESHPGNGPDKQGPPAEAVGRDASCDQARARRDPLVGSGSQGWESSAQDAPGGTAAPPSVDAVPLQSDSPAAGDGGPPAGAGGKSPR